VCDGSRPWLATRALGKHGLIQKNGKALTVNVESVPTPGRDGG
jgi:hypothetical protein